MERVFADAHYWIAAIDSRDPWYDRARSLAQGMSKSIIVTTDEVLVEVLNSFSGRGPHLRDAAVRMIYSLRRDPAVEVLEQSRDSFDRGLIRYYARHDKGYSLVDCISMNTMHQMGISRILTNDRHFAQEGFQVLLS
jgi:predicted nucleic acid-binding protein